MATTTLTADDRAALQLLRDRAEIHDVMMRYAKGVDSRAWQMITDCFLPDVKVEGWGAAGFKDRHELIEFIKGVANFHTTMHMMGNQFIEVDGDTASMETYAQLTHHLDRDEGPWELNLSKNRYIEKLTRQPDGRWIIHQRGGDPLWGPTGVTASQADDPALRWLLDRAELHDLMMHYALGIDAREYDRIGDCFAPTFSASYGIADFTDRGELLAFIKGVEHFESTNHFLGTQLIEVHGDEALMETAAMITHRELKDGQEVEWMAGGSRYVDRCARIDGRWKIVERGADTPGVPSGRAEFPTTDDPAVQQLLDRAEIHDVITTSAIAIDRNDEALLRSTLASSFADVPGLTNHLEPFGPFESSCHFLNNQLIDLRGDEAEVDTYLYLTVKKDGEMMCSEWSKGARRFVDRLVREGGRWRIAERRVEDNRVAQPA